MHHAQSRVEVFFISFVVVIGGLVLQPNLACAQLLEEVVVTAQKREENIQDVPIAITALDANILDRSQIVRVSDLSKHVPNLQFGNFSSTATAAIRGIGYTNTTAGGDPGVALHLDGVYIGRPIATVFSAWDLDRMEVLRGPQGTLYGRNTTGGSINFITQKPTDEFEAEIDLTYSGEFSRSIVQGVVNTPLGERAAARFSLSLENADGYQENTVPGGTEAGDADNTTFRAQFRFDIGENAVLDLLYNTAEIEGIGSTSESRVPYTTNPMTNWVGLPPPFVNTIFSDNFINGTGFASPGAMGIAAELDALGINTADDVRAALGLGAGAFLPPATPNFTGLTNELEPNLVGKDSQEWNEQEFDVAIATLTWNLDFATFTSITSYAETSFDSFIDLDQSPAALMDLFLEEYQKQYTQEFQLASNSDDGLEWIVGAYFFSEEATRFSTIFADEFDALATLLGRTEGFRVGGVVEADSTAIFGQISYDISDSLRFTAGARLSSDEKEAIINLISPFPAFNVATFVVDVPVSDSWDEPSGKIALDWRLSDDVLLYGSYSEGYKSGGVNLNGNPATGAIYDPEFNDVFEVGAKLQFSDRYRLNIAAFTNDYQDIQVQTFGPAGAELRNAAAATINGLELEGVFLFGETIDLNFAVGLLDAEFDEFLFTAPGMLTPPSAPGDPAGPPTSPPAVLDFSGNSLSRAPDITFSVGLQKRWDLADGSLTLRGDYYYQDEEFFGPNNAELVRSDSYDNLDLRVRWDSADDAWSVEVFVLNATDEEQIRDILQSIPFLAGGVDLTTYRAPRQSGLRFAYRF